MRAMIHLKSLVILVGAVTVASAQSLEQLYNSLNLTIALPPQNRALKGMGSPKIDPRLLAGPGQPAPSRAVGDFLPAIVAVRNSGDVAPVRSRIAAQGGTVTAVLNTTIYCRIPPAGVGVLAALPEVTSVSAQPSFSEPPTPRRAPGGGAERGLMAAGVALTHASLLHQKGIRGAGVKVGILDFGFSGYRDLQAKGHLPAPKAVRAFGKDGQWDRGTVGTRHGTACAEIVHAMAPESELYLAAVGTGDGSADEDETINAANWLMDQGVDIISYSGGGHFNPHNGTGVKDLLVEKAVRRGILWVVSAGNDGDVHWSTMAPAASGNRHLAIGGKDFLLVRAWDNGDLKIIVNWDDWGENPQQPHSSLDFEAVLDRVDPNTSRTTYVKLSADEQNGSAGSYPIEFIKASAKKGDLFALYILSYKVARPVRIHVYVQGPGEVYPVSPAGSIASPATSRASLAVGAVDVDKASLEDFSSEGPTDDGRAKPDVAGPDDVISEAEGHAFYGTSAACPFVAGFAALVRQMRGKVTPAELTRVIISSTTPLANNVGAGRGLIDAARLAGAGPPAAAPPTAGPAPPPPNPGQAPSARIVSLLRLARADNPLGLKVVTGHAEYRQGDGLKVGYRARSDAYCIVVRQTGGGAVAILQPSGAGELRLAGGVAGIFPAEPLQTIRLAGPAGTGQIGLICSASPLRATNLGQIDPQSLSVAVVSYRVE